MVTTTLSLKFKVDLDDIATIFNMEDILNDAEIERGPARDAVKEYCIGLLDAGDIEVREVEHVARCFVDGFTYRS